MDVDVSFIMSFESAVQILDFDHLDLMEYDDISQISFIELQNVAFNEMSGEMTVESIVDHCHPGRSDDMLFLPSYGSFVENLKRWDNGWFDNMTNSTTLEDFSGNEMSVNNSDIECSSDCEACLQVYLNTETSDVDTGIYSEDDNSNDLCYDFTNLWNQTEFTTYTDFPQDMMCARPTTTSENDKLLLRNKILAESNGNGNTTSGAATACFYDFSSTNT